MPRERNVAYKKLSTEPEGKRDNRVVKARQRSGSQISSFSRVPSISDFVPEFLMDEITSILLEWFFQSVSIVIERTVVTNKCYSSQNMGVYV